jgi:5'-3' exonuclease
MSKLLLVDHFALLHRSRNALLRTGREYTTSDGIPTTGVFSYLNSLLSIIKSQNPTHVVVCFDAGGNKRKEESATYKATRTAPDSKFISESRTLLNEALYAMGIESMGIKGFEADDIIYTLAHTARFGAERFDEIVIATVDQDILQCVNERTKVLLFNSAKKQVLMGVDEVVEKWSCNPDDIRFIKAISGDSSDNIIGVKGVGPKTALKILNDAKWVMETALEHPKLCDHRDQILANLDLVNLRLCVGEIGPVAWSDFELGRGLQADLQEFLERYEISSILKRFTGVAKTLKMEKLCAV